jgi:hypothetical protein
MTVETLYASSHLAGAFSSPDNALGNSPSTWAGDLNTNASYTSRWALADPVDPLTPAATQTVRVLARKGSNTGTPTIALNLYENGSLVGSILGATSITSTTGQTLTATFNTGQIANGADVEIEVVQSAVGGSGSARNSAQIAYIEWEADTSAVTAAPEGDFLLTDTSTLEMSGERDSSGAFGVSATETLSVSGSRMSLGEFAVSDKQTVEFTGGRESVGDFGSQDTTHVFVSGDANADPPPTGTFQMVDVSTVEMQGSTISVGDFEAQATDLVDVEGSRDSAGSFAVQETSTVEAAGERSSSGEYTEVMDSTTLLFAGGAASGGGSFEIVDSTSLVFAGGRDSSGDFEASDRVYVQFAAALVPVVLPFGFGEAKTRPEIDAARTLLPVKSETRTVADLEASHSTPELFMEDRTEDVTAIRVVQRGG